jgi:hypothetical protein
MDAASSLATMLDPSRIFQAMGMRADPWQKEVLLCPERYVLLNCSRQAGKSRVTSIAALHAALFTPQALVLTALLAKRFAFKFIFP